jgi:hypothetical protein
MAADEPSGPRPAPVVLRIKLRYDDVEAMAQRFAANVGKSGLFVPTKTMQPVGAEVKFELRLANDTPVITGLGRVRAARAPDPANPRAAFGLSIELMRVTRESRDVILKMLERRKQLGLPDVAIPMPEDIDAIRKDDTGVGSSPKAPPARDSAPPAAEGGGLAFTSPRRPTGPLAVAKVFAIAPLAPEPPRKRRAPVHELIESASGRIVAVMLPDLDEPVDVPAVLARARALAGGDLDAELDALREAAAAPIEITVEAASAELARQLGGKAVDRSARWATPPIVEATPGPMPIVTIVPVGEGTPGPMPVIDSAPMVEVTPVAATPIVEEPTPVVDAAAPIVEEPTPVGESAPIIEEPTPIAELAPDGYSVQRESSPALDVEPEQIADEIHRLDEGDFEEVEHTQHGRAPDPHAFDNHAYATESSVADLERSLEAQLADVDDDDLGISAAAPTGTIELAAAPPAGPEPDDELDPEDVEEINDFEILAEADEADADLLASDGEAETSARDSVPIALSLAEPEPRPRFSDSDFAERLDLGDDLDDESDPPAPPPPPSDHHLRSLAEIDPSTGELDPMMISAAHAIAAFDDDQEVRALAYPPLHAFDQSDVIAPPDLQPRTRRDSQLVRPQPQPVRRSVPTAAPEPTPDNYDLETALEALDVDLDDLSFPHAKTEIPRKVSPASPRRHPRAASEDGVLIDFDDDE